MTSYETKLGAAKIISGRELCQGKWGVRAKLASGRELFISFDGKPELEAAFPAPEWMSVKTGPRTDVIDMMYEDMDRAGSHR